MTTPHRTFGFSWQAPAVILMIGLILTPVAHGERVSPALEEISPHDRANIELIVTIDPDAGTASQTLKSEVENLWRSGDYSEAISKLRLLENSSDIGGISVAQLYKEPVLSSIASPDGTDVLVTSIDSAVVVDFDVDYRTGTIFICFVYRIGSTNNYVYYGYSTDGGQSWNTIMTSAHSQQISDIDCAVVDEYCFFAYTENLIHIDVRRWDIDAGAWSEFGFPPPGSMTQTAYTTSTGVIRDIEILTTNDLTVSPYEACYIVATISTGDIVVLAADSDFWGWLLYFREDVDAWTAMDATLNPENGTYGSPYRIYVSFVSQFGELAVVGISDDTVWRLLTHSLSGVTRFQTSIGAWGDTVFCAFTSRQGDHDEVEIARTVNGVYGWDIWVLEGEEEEDWGPDITARRGEGVAVIYSSPFYNFPLTGTYGRVSWFHTDYNPWHGPANYTAYRASNARPNIEYIGNGYYGITWITDWTSSRRGQVYFDAMPRCCQTVGNANSDGTGDINISDITYLVDYLFGIPLGPAPNCLEEGNANGDGAGDINISDITYLVEYLFGIPLGPPPPACP